jgi:hypothetical protein
MTNKEYDDMRAAAVEQHGESYVKGVDIATRVLLSAGKRNWAGALAAENELDVEDSRMLDGYNDRMAALSGADYEAVIQYIDANIKKGLQ